MFEAKSGMALIVLLSVSDRSMMSSKPSGLELALLVKVYVEEERPMSSAWRVISVTSRVETSTTSLNLR